MARFKADRAMKVHSISGKSYLDRKPAIQLSGEWVRDLGFDIGEAINVRCEQGRLTITLETSEEFTGHASSNARKDVLMVVESGLERSMV